MFLFIWSGSSDVYYAKLETRNAKRETWTGTNLDYEWSPFFLRDTKADQRRARRKIPPREKGEMWRSSRLAFLAWGVPSRSRFARPVLFPRKNGDYSMSRTNASGVVGVAFKSLLYQALSLHSCYFVTTFLPLVVLFWVTYSVSSRNYFGVLNSAQLVCVPSVERGMGRKWKREGGWGQAGYAQWTKNWSFFSFFTIFCFYIYKRWFVLINILCEFK